MDNCGKGTANEFKVDSKAISQEVTKAWSFASSLLKLGP